MSPVVMKIPVPRIEPDRDQRAVPGAETRGRAAGARSPARSLIAMRGFYRTLAAGRRERHGRLAALPMTDDIRIRPARRRAPTSTPASLSQRAIWGLSDLEITVAIQLIATIHAGGLLHLAETAGATRPSASPTRSRASRGTVPHLHSDMVAVLPEYQKRGVGVRLKWAQREEALARGITAHHLDLRSAAGAQRHLNLRRLGATAPSSSGTSTGSRPRPCITAFRPTASRPMGPQVSARRGARAREGEPARSRRRRPASRASTRCKWQGGWPVASEPRLDLDAADLLLEIPPDWDALCQAAPRVAEGWQEIVRRAFETYFSRGYRAVDFAPTEEGGRRRPFYVLRKPAVG